MPFTIHHLYDTHTHTEVVKKHTKNHSVAIVIVPKANRAFPVDGIQKNKEILRDWTGISQEAELHPGVKVQISKFSTGLASIHAEKLALTSQLLVCPHYTAE